MSKFFKKVLFGYHPAEVTQEIEKIETEQQKEVQTLKGQIKEAQVQIHKQEEFIAELKKKLEEFTEREHIISDVMITAQRNAQRIEEDAREKAQNMIEEAEEKQRRKQQELDNLRIKVSGFKEEFQRILEKYQSSLDTVAVPPGEQFIPTLITSKK